MPVRHAPPADRFDPAPTPQALRGRILLTGATGFLGQALLERLLADHPDTHIDLLLRGTGTGTDSMPAAARLADLTRRAAFRPWRARVGDARAEAIIRRRVSVLPGSLADAPALLARRPPYDLVIHAAGDVSFRAPIGQAFATNVEGPRALYEALRRRAAVHRPGSPPPAPPHVIHVSTAYVWTDRIALAPETSLPHEVDWRVERELVRHAGAHPGGVGADAAAIAAGRHRARSLGFTDVYTYTKALGERVAEQICAQMPVTVLRPTIIESALSRPFPGWLDGFKVADPVIVAYARGRLRAFPGAPQLVLDIIPVDIVVNAVLASARRPPTPGEPRYLHVGTSMSNPLRLGDLRHNVQRHAAAHPWIAPDGRAVRPRPIRFGAPETMSGQLRLGAGAIRQLRRLNRRLPGGADNRAEARLARTARRLATMREFLSLYQPYSCSTTRYGDAALRALDGTRPAAERRREPLDVTTWLWDDYLMGVHLPAVRRLMDRRFGSAPAAQPMPRPSAATQARAS